MKTVNKQSKIMDVAEELFCRYGSKETTVRLITQKAGINISMLHYYFKSKENLFLMIIDRRINHLKTVSKSADLKDKSLIEQFLSYTEIYINLIAGHLSFYKLMMIEKLLNDNKMVVKKINYYFDLNTKSLKKIIEKGKRQNNLNTEVIDSLLINITSIIIYNILKSDENSPIDPFQIQQSISGVLKNHGFGCLEKNQVDKWKNNNFLTLNNTKENVFSSPINFRK